MSRRNTLELWTRSDSGRGISRVSAGVIRGLVAMAMGVGLLGFGVGPAGAVERRPVVIAAGVGHACAVSGSGGAECWGGNLAGQLGHGGAEASTNLPVAVSGLGSGVVAVAAGDSFSCALSDAGAVSCWGAGANGRLGNGGTGGSPTPTAVTGLSSGVRAIALGWEHACALLLGGELRCWGRNHVGQLGNLSIADSTVPVTTIPGTSDPAVAVSAGQDHTCAVLASGRALCWGSNAEGKAGIGVLVESFLTTPVGVASDHTDFASIAAGSDHTCARTRKGRVLCWGGNDHGQLGIGTTGGVEAAPVEVKSLRRVDAVAAGDGSSCALTAKGTVLCFGSNGLGSLGIGTTEDSPLPVAMPLPERAQAIATGGSVSCAALASGQMRCAGDGSSGELGNGDYGQSNEPVAVASLSVRPDLPVLSVGDSAVVEGDAGILRVPFARTLSKPAGSDVFFDITTYPGSATNFEPDYTPSVGNIGIGKGKTDLGRFAKEFGPAVTSYGDESPEGDEDFLTVASSPSGATLLRGVGRGVILNDDPGAGPGLRVHVGDASVVEGDERVRTVNEPISLSSPADERVGVAWKVTGGTATARVDFLTRRGTAVLVPGDVGQTAFASIRVAGDRIPEVDETLEIVISVRSANAVVGRAVGTATILDDD